MLTILYFAQLKDTLECSEESLEWHDSYNSIEALKHHLCQRNELWQQAFTRNILSAVNQSMVADNHPLQDGDEIAFFPPVTGG
jgi:molybdopterin synthase sulfur carrier subunit